MNISKHPARLAVFGAAALVALATGCSHERGEARSAQDMDNAAVGVGSMGGGMSGQSGQQGAPGQQSSRQGSSTNGQGSAAPQSPSTPQNGGQGSAAQPNGQQGGTGAQGMGGMKHEHAEGMSERDLCGALAQHGNLRVENIDQGIAIVSVPRAGTDLTTVRSDALHLAYSLAPPGGMAGARPASEGDRCPLFDLNQLADRTGVVEKGNEIHILFVSQDKEDVNTLRARVRSFVEGQQGQGGQQGEQGQQGEKDQGPGQKNGGQKKQ